MDISKGNAYSISSTGAGSGAAVAMDLSPNGVKDVDSAVMEDMKRYEGLRFPNNHGCMHAIISPKRGSSLVWEEKNNFDLQIEKIIIHHA